MNQSDFDWQQKDGYESIRGRECEITIEPRPHYCDRGNYLAKIHPEGKLLRDMDAADGWPRYYFSLDVAKQEVVSWMLKRGQLVLLG